jgi:putative addiction module killer protein/probable addiction module antidote protein
MPYAVQRTDAFETWLGTLADTDAQDAIVARIGRLEAGLLGDRKSVGAKIGELRIDVGQGYRVYYTMRGLEIALLLCGGVKKTQKADIRKAEAMAKAIGKPKERRDRVRERQADYAGPRAPSEEEFSFTEEQLRISPFDIAESLERDSSQVSLLRDALASGHAGYIANAIGAIARARGLTAMERDTGIKRQTLNKSLSLKGNPTLETLLAVLGALGLKLEIVADDSR